MALDQIHLRKLLNILFLEPRDLQSALRADIREEIARGSGQPSAGGDFYGPFWHDAKDHVFGAADLHRMVDERIAANSRRSNLYPRLRDGFLLWWGERRRWTNEPFRPGRSWKTRFSFPGLNTTVKVEGLLTVRDRLNVERVIYPYFGPEPPLSEQASRWGLWLLTRALPAIPSGEIRILDVIRGQTFSLDRVPLHGNEEEEFRRRYAEVMRQRARLREEYKD